MEGANQNPASTGFAVYVVALSRRDHQPLVLDFNLETLPRLEACVLKPTARDLEPRVERWIGAVAVQLQTSVAPRVLNRDMSLGMSRT
jgi:hypothetical protein